MWKITLNDKLHLAPIGPEPQEVLDIGTGKGNWPIDFGIDTIFHSHYSC
jgi:hypothetical protein